MKKLYGLAAVILAAGTLNAQTFNDDFESYALGDYVGDNSPIWTTWSGTTGTSEDVQVTDVNAHNGSHSIYFSSTSANGGPQDVLLPFGGVHNVGQFELSAWFFVENGKNGYFNFQGTNTAGQMYSMNCNLESSGELVMDDASSVVLTASFPVGVWFKLEMDINLNTNEWELLIDNVSQGVFQVADNQVASMDLYPINGSGYFVDEIGYNHTPYTLPSRNGAVIAINDFGRLASQEFSPSVVVRNLGTQTINSFDVTIDYQGTQITENVTGIAIPSLGTYTVEFSQLLTMAAGANPLMATISNVNGTAGDDDANDDVKTITLDPVIPAQGKMVLAEEGTGTWCGWCPRGAVMLDRMEDNYHDYFAGIAVHNGDPMTVALYDDGLNFSSFPTSRTDRGVGMNPALIEGEFLERITIMPSALLTNGAYFNEGSNKLYVSVSADFVAPISGDYRLACALTEDSVTGTGSGYAQSNYYSGGSNGEMGGYELLPNPVPASQMVYDHVARAILPNVNGQANSFPGTVSVGEEHIVAFVFDIDPSWDLSKMHIIGFLINPDGEIDNAGRATIEEAIANGYLSIDDGVTVQSSVDPIYPNPSNEISFFDINVESASPVTLTILDMQGRLIAEKNYGTLEGTYKLPIQTDLLSTGVYVVNIRVGNEQHAQRLTVE